MKFRPITVAAPLVVIAVIIASWLLGLLKTTEVVITQSGISCATDGEILQKIAVTGKNYWEINQTRLESDLINQFPCVSSASFSYRFPNQIKLEVTNRTPIATVVSYLPKPQLLFTESEATPSSSSASLDWSFPELSPGYLVVDQLGKVFSAQDVSWLPLLLIEQEKLEVGDDFDDQLFTNLAMVIKKLPQIGIPAYRFKKVGEYLLADSKPAVAVNLKSDINIQLASLQLILSKTKIDSKELEVVDLRFNKPVVVYSSKKQ